MSAVRYGNFDSGEILRFAAEVFLLPLSNCVCPMNEANKLIRLHNELHAHLCDVTGVDKNKYCG